MKLTGAFLISFIAFLVSAPNGTSANGMVTPKCGFVTPVERLKTSKAVFSGEAIEVSESEGIQLVRFRVSQSWKHARVGEVTVTNFVHHEGPYFHRGRSYLVYAYKRNGKLSTGGCSGTVEVEDAQDAIKQLNKWQLRNKSKGRSSSGACKAIVLENARSITSACSGLAGEPPLFVVEWASR